MSPNIYVEIGIAGMPIRIFKNQKAAIASTRAWAVMARNQAVGQIRHQLFIRSEGHCEFCDERVTECGGHMHERVHRGQGGEISLANSVFICATCHAFAHTGRNPHWSKHDSQSK